jgi:hypothetical protein
MASDFEFVLRRVYAVAVAVAKIFSLALLWPGGACNSR